MVVVGVLCNQLCGGREGGEGRLTWALKTELDKCISSKSRTSILAKLWSVIININVGMFSAAVALFTVQQCLTTY